MKKQELIDRILKHEPEMYESWFKATKELRMWTCDLFDSMVKNISYHEFIENLKPEMYEKGITDLVEQKQYQEDEAMKYIHLESKKVYDGYVSDFIHHINTNLDPQIITVYRNLRIPSKDYELFKSNLKNNILMYGFSGVGKCWTINQRKAKTDYMPLKSEFIGLPTMDVMLKAEIENYSIINCYETFLANISPDYFEEEEITLDLGTKVNIKFINDESVDILVDV